MTPADLLVLSDFLQERLSPDQAAFVLKAASYPQQVQLLFELPLPGQCSCGMDVDDYAYDDALTHAVHCKVVNALRLLKDSRFEHVVDQAWHIARREQSERAFEQQHDEEAERHALELRRENQRRMRARQPIAATHSSHLPAEDLEELEPEPATSSYFDDE